MPLPRPTSTRPAKLRKRIEEIFGWAKQIGGMAQVKLRGLAKVDLRFTLTLAAYNLVRLHKLVAT